MRLIQTSRPLRYTSVSPSKTLFSMLVFVGLVACGGGGGGGGDAAPPTGEISTPQTTTFSGVISLAPNTRTDSDNNDSAAASRVSNNSFDTAQPLPNPVNLNGYVNDPNTGPSGPLRTSGDDADVYQLSLLENQSISLSIADFDPNDPLSVDLDLVLFDANQQEVRRSERTTDRESITVPADGDYFVVVFPFEGASSYVLSIGQNAAIQSASEPSWVPNEAIVKFKPGYAPADSARAIGASSVTAPANDMPVLMRWDDSAEKLASMGISADSSRSINSASASTVKAKRASLAAWQTMAVIKEFKARHSEIEYIEPNYMRRTSLTPNDRRYPIQWHYPQIKLPQAWDITTGSNQVIVGVIDTGVLINHPDIQPQLTTGDPDGYDFISDVSISADGDGRDGNANDPGDRESVNEPSSFHGTHVAGTVAAATNNSLGVAGAGFNTRIMPLRALGRGGAGSSFDIQQAMLYAAGLNNASGQFPPQRADIINLSLGGPGRSNSDQEAINRVRQAGVIIVAAAGNTGGSGLEFPASYDGVISVAATDIQRRRAFYSTANASVDIAAPGGDSSTDVNGDGFADGVLSTGARERADGTLEFLNVFLQGTSMATPHVAGVIALMKDVYPGLTPAILDDMLSNGEMTTDLGPAGRDNSFGMGLIDAQKAVSAARTRAGNGGLAPATLAVTPQELNFGSSANQLTVIAENSGDEPLLLLGVSESAPWLTVQAESVDGDNLGQYSVNVDRSGLADGVYTAPITFDSNVNDVIVNVIMQVGGDSEASAGTHFTLLLDANSGEILAQAISQANNGQYEYELSVELENPTSVEILSGSDIDNDLFICGGGEACGSYLTLDRPLVIDAQPGDDFRNLNFNTDIDVILQSSSAGAKVGASSGGIQRLPIGSETAEKKVQNQ